MQANYYVEMGDEIIAVGYAYCIWRYFAIVKCHSDWSGGYALDRWWITSKSYYAHSATSKNNNDTTNNNNW